MIEFLLFCGIILIVIILISLSNKVAAGTKRSETDLTLLRHEIIDIKKLLLEREEKAKGQVVETTTVKTEPTPPVVEIKTVEAQAKTESVQKTEEIAPVEEPAKETAETPLTIADIEAMFPDQPESVVESQQKITGNITEVGQEAVVEEKLKTRAELFAPKPAKEIDYEKYIGENLISKIGIAILVLAIGFFVKFAIDNNWINEVGRVCIGLACGGILVGLAHRLRKDYKAFSSVLVGGGLAVFYFTIALAYHQFHLFDQTTSFAIMVVITIFAVVLSLLYDRQELAVISMVGGYATPFLVSNGSGNYIALFSYLCILNTGLLIIAYMRMWRVLNLLAFLFTVIIFSSWLFTLPNGMTPGVYQNAFIFATVFFLFFFTACLAHNIKEKKKFLPFDFSMMLANSVWYFSIGLYMIMGMHAEQYKGLFSACMAGFYLIVSYFLFRHQRTDKNILYLLIGITLTFISITAPLQLEGSFITLFWASEAVLLYWLYRRSDIRIIAIGSTIVSCITVFSLMLNWSHHYTPYNGQPLMNIIINKAFITSIYTALCFAAVYYLRSRKKSEDKPELSFPFLLPQNLFLIASVSILFLAGVFEIAYQFGSRLNGSEVYVSYLMLYLLVFATAAVAIVQRYTRFPLGTMLRTIILSTLVAIYIFHLPFAYHILHDLLARNVFTMYFAAHWVAALIVPVLIWRVITDVRILENIDAAVRSLLTWALTSTIVIFLSAELFIMVIGIFYNGEPSISEISRVYVKAILPILWGVCSFAFMWVGMKRQYKDLRIISLVLFAVTLLKLFMFDISNVPIGGKIAAFFCLGVLLLVVSFMYQRLKKILIDGEKKHE
ncbi:MAG: hypothetical protein JWO03_489 [Bacteroidetes bacterium]|nr:hypothetical protein [Bacteroidota bacterium]